MPKNVAKPREVCSVLIYHRQKFLLVQEAQQRVYSKWNLPGGHRDDNETRKEAAIRETKEETGYKIELVKLLRSFVREADGRVLYVYSGRIIGGELKFPRDELLDAKWFSEEEIDQIKSQLRDPKYVVESIKLAKMLR